MGSIDGYVFTTYIRNLLVYNSRQEVKDGLVPGVRRIRIISFYCK